MFLWLQNYSKWILSRFLVHLFIAIFAKHNPTDNLVWSGANMNIQTGFCCNLSSCWCCPLKDPVIKCFHRKWRGTKSTVLVLCKNISQSLSEAYFKLQQSEFVKSSGYLPKLQSFQNKICSLCLPGAVSVLCCRDGQYEQEELQQNQFQCSY